MGTAALGSATSRFMGIYSSSRKIESNAAFEVLEGLQLQRCVLISAKYEPNMAYEMEMDSRHRRATRSCTRNRAKTSVLRKDVFSKLFQLSTQSLWKESVPELVQISKNAQSDSVSVHDQTRGVAN